MRVDLGQARFQTSVFLQNVAKIHLLSDIEKMCLKMTTLRFSAKKMLILLPLQKNFIIFAMYYLKTLSK